MIGDILWWLLFGVVLIALLGFALNGENVIAAFKRGLAWVKDWWSNKL